MSCSENCSSALCKTVYYAFEHLAGRVVNSGKRFVQEKDLRILSKSASQQSALLLTAGEHSYLPFRQFAHAQVFDRLLHDFMINPSGAAHPPEMNETPCHYEPTHRNRKSPVDISVLGKVRHTMMTAPYRQSRNPDGPLPGAQYSAYRFHQG